MSYATLEEFDVWIGNASTSATSASRQRCLDAGAEAIDAACMRTFTTASSATSAEREYVAGPGERYLFVDDFTGSATIDGTAQTAVVPHDQTRPRNTLIGTWVAGETYAVTAQWGWPAVPQRVKLANLMLAAKLDQRRQSPNGIERGNDDQGFIRILGVDKDVEELLRPLVRTARSFA